MKKSDQRIMIAENAGLRARNATLRARVRDLEAEMNVLKCLLAKCRDTLSRLQYPDTTGQ